MRTKGTDNSDCYPSLHQAVVPSCTVHQLQIIRSSLLQRLNALESLSERFW